MSSPTHPTPRGHLYLVGVGPGDPELMTVKAVRILQHCQVWATPSAKNGNNGFSSALAIAQGIVAPEKREILRLFFPMKPVYLDAAADPALLSAWNESAATVLARLDQGLDVAFPTLGDPGVYSTAFYLLAAIQSQRPDVRFSIVPGITAMSACSAGQARPLALGNDVLAVVPAAFADDRLHDILTQFDAVVLMKVHKRLDILITLLEELGLCEQAVLIECAGLPEERIYTDIRSARGRKLHYFSTILIRKKSVQVQP
ncbi:MAG: precorrin-2 C(20)-methyltransferase [Desulfobulbus sp.]|jgi:precorrin-2/cobalt-factor-2 C20-methyltransferase